MITAAYVLLLLAGALFLIRILRGPSLTERVLSLDGLLVTGVSAIAVQAVDSGSGTFLPVAVVLTLVGFIGTAVVARFIEGQGG